MDTSNFQCFSSNDRCDFVFSSEGQKLRIKAEFINCELDEPYVSIIKKLALQAKAPIIEVLNDLVQRYKLKSLSAATLKSLLSIENEKTRNAVNLNSKTLVGNDRKNKIELKPNSDSVLTYTEDDMNAIDFTTNEQSKNISKTTAGAVEQREQNRISQVEIKKVEADINNTSLETITIARLEEIFLSPECQKNWVKIHRETKYLFFTFFKIEVLLFYAKELGIIYNYANAETTAPGLETVKIYKVIENEGSYPELFTEIGKNYFLNFLFESAINKKIQTKKLLKRLLKSSSFNLCVKDLR